MVYRSAEREGLLLFEYIELQPLYIKYIFKKKLGN